MGGLDELTREELTALVIKLHETVEVQQKEIAELRVTVSRFIGTPESNSSGAVSNSCIMSFVEECRILLQAQDAQVVRTKREPFRHCGGFDNYLSQRYTHIE